MGEVPQSGGAGAVCPVCGSMLAPPVVACPGCRTPHHQDCWSYNDGCAIYGCGVAGSAALPALPDPAIEGLPVPASAGEAPRLLLTWIGLLAALAALVGLHVIPQPLAVVFGLGLLVRIRQVQDQAWHSSIPAGDLDPPDQAEELALEQKAVVSLVGGGQTARLAQAYALFEQRRPRDSVGDEAQRALALELAAGGYRVLAAEALEKAMARAGTAAGPGLVAAYRALFRDDPAFSEEAALGPAASRARDPLPAAAGKLPEDPRFLLTGGPQYLLCLARRGLRIDLQRGYRLPGEAPGDLAARTRWIAGPFGPRDLEAQMSAFEAAGYPVLPADPDELALPGGQLRVTGLTLSQKSACISTAGGTEVFDWDELLAFHYARVVRIEKSQVLDLRIDYSGKPQQATGFGLKPREERHSDSLIEIHAGSPLVRYRIETVHPGLFDYLGRRKEGAWEINLRLVAKDLVRFAPALRAGHGVHAMVSERMATGEDFASRRELEEYLLWFHALGSPRLRAFWAHAVRPRPLSPGS